MLRGVLAKATLCALLSSAVFLGAALPRHAFIPWIQYPTSGTAVTFNITVFNWDVQETAAVIHLASFVPTATYPTSLSVAVNPSGKYAYALLGPGPNSPTTLYVIATDTNQIVKTVPLNLITSPAGYTADINVSALAVSNDGLTIWIVDGVGNQVVALCALTYQVLQTIAIESPQQVVFSPDGKSAYVFSIGTPQYCCDPVTDINVFSTSTRKLTASANTYGRFDSATFSPDGSHLYFGFGSLGTDQRYGITVLGTKPLQQAGFVNVNVAEHGFVTSLAVTPDGKDLYSLVTDADSNDSYLAVSSTADNTVLSLDHVAFDPPLFYVGFTPDGADIFLVGNDIEIAPTATRVISKQIPFTTSAFAFAQGLAFLPLK